MKNLFIEFCRNSYGGYIISDGATWRIYSGYTKRDAVKLFRAQTNQTGKHFNIYDYTKC